MGPMQVEPLDPYPTQTLPPRLDVVKYVTERYLVVADLLVNLRCNHPFNLLGNPHLNPPHLLRLLPRCPLRPIHQQLLHQRLLRWLLPRFLPRLPPHPLPMPLLCQLIRFPRHNPPDNLLVNHRCILPANPQYVRSPYPPHSLASSQAISLRCVRLPNLHHGHRYSLPASRVHGRANSHRHFPQCNRRISPPCNHPTNLQ